MLVSACRSKVSVAWEATGRILNEVLNELQNRAATTYEYRGYFPIRQISERLRIHLESLFKYQNAECMNLRHVCVSAQRVNRRLISCCLCAQSLCNFLFDS